MGRNPKDACVSWYYHCKLKGTFTADFNAMAKAFKDGLQPYAPIMPHMLEAWQHKDNPNLYFTTYEVMKKDIVRVISDLTSFMGKKRLSEDKMKRLLAFIDIDSMRGNR